MGTTKKTKRTRKKPQRVKLRCRECRTDTNHNILFTDSHSDEDDRYGVWWTVDNHLVKCMGCDNVALYRHSIDSESLPDANDEMFPDPRQGREPINDYILLPKQLRQIYRETLKAIDSNQSILTGIGIRAIVETVCAER